MSGMNAYLQKALLDHLFLSGVPYEPPAAYYISLHTADPGDFGSLVGEVSTIGTGYARQSLSAKMGAADASSGVMVNTGVIDFGIATTAWGLINFIGINDAITGGNQIMRGSSAVPKLVSVGLPFKLFPGQLRLRFD